jgi:hypothetical protein
VAIGYNPSLAAAGRGTALVRGLAEDADVARELAERAAGVVHAGRGVLHLCDDLPAPETAIFGRSAPCTPIQKPHTKLIFTGKR